jgi:hypothetical protein
LRETDRSRTGGDVRLQVDTPYAEPPLTRVEPRLFGASIDEPRPRSGLSIWLAAAAALVIGIGLGFASGYRAGKGSPVVAATENPAATSGATGGQPFSEAAVQEPINLNPEPVVPAPEVPAGPPRGLKPAAEPAPQKTTLKPAAEPAPRQNTEKRSALTAVGRVPPRTEAVAADPPVPPVTGPASLEVVSRPAGAQVFFDGRSVGKTPMTIPDVSTGFHDIRLELSGFRGWSTTVGVKAGVATRVTASLEQ